MWLHVIDDSEGPDCSVGSFVWVSLTELNLTKKDRGIITEENELNDKHIDFVHLAIQHQFTNIEGLVSTLLFKQMMSSIFIRLSCHTDHQYKWQSLDCSHL